MADSTTRLNADLPVPDAPRRIAVAYSGGRDSTALLHVTARLCAALNLEGAAPPVGVVALHVHHGLSRHADDWLTHAQAQCAAWARQGLPVILLWRRVNLDTSRGHSVEALARDARYEALAEMAREAGCDAVLLAHHQRDQAETFVLQALRSAGTRGLSAMPRWANRAGITWLRPWLDRPADDVHAYVRLHGLVHVEDDSNGDERFARNRLRQAVWPAFSTAFEHVEASLAQAAAHQADLAACLDDWLAHQLPAMTRQRTGGLVLDVARWADRPPGPQRELLRAWFKQATGSSLDQGSVHRIQRALMERLTRAEGAGTGAARWPLPALASLEPQRPRELLLHRGLLSVRVAPVAEPADSAGEVEVSIPGCGILPLPAGWGSLEVLPAEQGGVDLTSLASCRLVRRRGGEQFQAGPQRPPRSLKKQFQMLGVPAWARHGPLLYAGTQLVFVPGLGIDARVQREPGRPQVQLVWHPPVSEPACQG